jgi:hypothetical protein
MYLVCFLIAVHEIATSIMSSFYILNRILLFVILQTLILLILNTLVKIILLSAFIKKNVEYCNNRKQAIRLKACKRFKIRTQWFMSILDQYFRIH